MLQFFYNKVYILASSVVVLSAYMKAIESYFYASSSIKNFAEVTISSPEWTPKTTGSNQMPFGLKLLYVPGKVLDNLNF